ncbi:hypothetical protein V2J09_023597 [Rumex salicifolius]
MTSLFRSLAEDGNDDDSHTSTPKQKFTKIIEHVRQEDYVQEIVAKVEPIFRRVVRQELEAALGPLESSQRFFLGSQPKSSTSTRTLQLAFLNKPRATFFTNTRILAEGHNSSVTIQLIDASSKEVVSDAPFGSVEVNIFAMDGDFLSDGQEDWSNIALKDSIVREREGRRPLLVGELSFSLTHGIGCIKDVIFTDNSSWLRSRRFKLGVRAVSSTFKGVRIIPGISEAFVVLEHRGESYRKHDIPFLNDPLWRLKRISKNGAICTKLSEIGIHTVKDFLRLYHINPKLLRQIVGSGIANKTWESIITHANICCLDNTLYTYYHVATEVSLLLNCVYKVLRVTFDGITYQSLDALNKQQMALLEHLQHYIYCNPNVLCPIDVPSTCPSISCQLQNNNPVFNPSFDPWDNDPHITNQGNSLVDVTHSDPSASNPYMTVDSYNLEDFANYHSQPIEYAHWSSSSQLSNQAYEWNPYVLDQNFTSSQPLIFHPDFTTSGGGKSKACWVKIRALLKWKMVKRDAAAKKKEKLQLDYYQSQSA